MSPVEPQTPTLSEAPSTPRHSMGNELGTENEDKDNDNVFFDNINELPLQTRHPEGVLDKRNVWLESERQIERRHSRRKSNLGEAENNNKPSVISYRSRIESDV